MPDDSAKHPYYLSLLSDEEHRRLAALSNAIVKSRHIEVRGKLREVLSGVLHQHPAQIGIARSVLGKPYLPDYPQVVFNISHTDNQLVIAVGENCQLGVDIERCKFRASLDAMVAKCFADEEAAYWHSLPDAQKVAAFYQFWTKKEAFVKATGRGIALGLQRCVIDPQQPEKFLRLPEGYPQVADWQIVTFGTKTPGNALCGAIVVDGDAEIQHICGKLNVFSCGLVASHDPCVSKRSKVF